MKKLLLPLLVLLVGWVAAIGVAAPLGNNMLYAPLIYGEALTPPPTGLEAYQGLLLRSSVAGTPPSTNLYAMRADGSDLRPLATFSETVTYMGSIEWSPDNRQVAFTTDALYIVNWDGSDLHRVELGLRNVEVKGWTPDSQALILESTTPTSGQQLHWFDPATETLRTGEVHGGFSTVEWFPDGRYFLIGLWDSVDRQQIGVVDSTDMSETLLTDSYYAHSFIGFIGEESRILMRASDYGESRGYYLMDRDGSNVTSLWEDLTGIIGVTPRRDGFLYTDGDLYRYGVPPTTPTLLADLPCAEANCLLYELDFSADGERIVFAASTSAGERELWVASLYPTTPVPTSPVATGLVEPQWVDGTRYLVARTVGEQPTFRTNPVLLDLAQGTETPLFDDPNYSWRSIEWRYLP